MVQIQDSAADIGAAISDLTEALGSMNVAVSSMATKEVEEVERKSSVRGVSYHKPLKKCLVRIMKDRHSYHGGFYESKKEAEKVVSGRICANSWGLKIGTGQKKTVFFVSIFRAVF